MIFKLFFLYFVHSLNVLEPKLYASRISGAIQWQIFHQNKLVKFKLHLMQSLQCTKWKI